ncbi:MAG: hybrid sensor histidine kinase/response regulator [Verrucomicrobiota bacterium]
MIVDDEPGNLNVLGAMLSGAGLGVRALPGGALALAAARAELPDLVLLDIQMPGMDGYEVCRRFKADEQLRGVPIIFLSAFTQPSDKLRAFEAGGVDYVTKPFAEVEVLARIGTHLQLRRHQLHLEELVAQRMRELTEANRRLQLWDDAKNQWLNMLSHEIRTPLNGVIGIAELLFADLPPASEHHALRPDYDMSCLRIEKLIDDALTVTQLDVTAEGFAARMPVRLMPLLEEAVAAVTRQAGANPVHAALSGVDDVTLCGEARLLRRAFTDLLLTATHCVVAGEAITLVTQVAAGQAHVQIITRGAALSSAALETFFEVGGQRELLKGAGDFGLGATLASHIIQLFHGSVTVRNGTQGGLVISVSLPVADSCTQAGCPDL